MTIFIPRQSAQSRRPYSAQLKDGIDAFVFSRIEGKNSAWYRNEPTLPSADNSTEVIGSLGISSAFTGASKNEAAFTLPRTVDIGTGDFTVAGVVTDISLTSDDYCYLFGANVAFSAAIKNLSAGSHVAFYDGTFVDSGIAAPSGSVVYAIWQRKNGRLYFGLNDDGRVTTSDVAYTASFASISSVAINNYTPGASVQGGFVHNNVFTLFADNADIDFDEFLANPWHIFQPTTSLLSVTSSAGSTASLSGIASTSAYGNIPAQTQIPQTGQELTASVGAIAATVDYLAALTGLSSSAVIGAISPAMLAAISGSASTVQNGALSPELINQLTGVAGASQYGSLTASQDLILALLGLSATPAYGNPYGSSNFSLSGSAISPAYGTITASQDTIQAITGLSSAASFGALISGLSTAVAGLASTLAYGAVTPLTGIIAALTGLEASAIQGALGKAVARTLAGNAAALNTGSALPGVSFSLTGAETASAKSTVGVTVQVGTSGATLTLANGTITVYNPDVTLGLTGTQAAISRGLFNPALQKALFGQDLVLSQASVFAAISALSNGQALTFSQGSQAITVAKDLSGRAMLSGSGTVLFTDNNLDIALSGTVITTSQGRIFIKGGALGSSSITILQV